MYLKHISVKSYGPIENLSYSFREDEKGNPVPLAIIGKNGCGKTLLFANIVDMFVEMKRQIYPQGILYNGVRHQCLIMFSQVSRHFFCHIGCGHDQQRTVAALKHLFA